MSSQLTCSLLIFFGAVSAASANGVEWPTVTTYATSNRGPAPLFLRPDHELIRAVRSQDEWNRLWQEFPKDNLVDQTQAPLIDFQKYTMLITALGTRPQGGYSVIIESVYADTSGVIVNVLETHAVGRECVVTAAVTYPYAIALIPRTSLPVNFRLESADLDCRDRYLTP